MPASTAFTTLGAMTFEATSSIWRNQGFYDAAAPYPHCTEFQIRVERAASQVCAQYIQNNSQQEGPIDLKDLKIEQTSNS